MRNGISERLRAARGEAGSRDVSLSLARSRRTLATMKTSLFWRVVTDLARADAPGLAAELAYRSFFALIPSLLFCAAIFSVISPIVFGPHVRPQVEHSIKDNLPPDAANFLAPYLTALIGRRSGDVLSLSLILSLWTASSVVTTVMKAAERTLQMRERRSYLNRHLQALALVAFLPALLGGSLALTWFGQQIGRLLLANYVDDYPARFALRISLSVLLGFLATGPLLRIAPPRPPRLPPLLAGTAVSGAGLWLASELFALYAGHYAHYGSAYGLIGGGIALLAWFYVCSFALLVGIEVMGLCGEGWFGPRWTGRD